MEEKWFLEGRDDAGKRWSIAIDTFPFLLGRSANCNLSLTNSSISREHTLISMIKGEIFVEDCNSTNGTKLNGRTLNKSARLYENDKLALCDYEFKLIKEKKPLNDVTIISSSISPLEEFSRMYNLTPRESELLGYLVKGLSTKEIASSMFISTGTAKNHILNLLKKTDTHSRLELIRTFENIS